ncbi:MAG: NAD(P)H-quinone oxidoreductase subunit O [Coleofasciculaceae cyanobacterium]
MASIKKGSMVRANREKLENSVEIQASDSRLPPYLFETSGEVVDMKGDYAFIKFGQVPTPNIWLHIDQLDEAGAAATTEA